MESKNIYDLAQFFATVPLLSSLQKPELKEIASKAKEFTLLKDSYLFKKNTLASDFYIIKEGIIEETVSDNNDFTISVKTHTSKEYIGELAVVLSEPYINTARALTDVKIITIPQDVFKRLLFKEASVMKFILRKFSERLHNCAKTTLSFLMFNSEGRLAYRLLMMLSAQGEGDFKVRMTQEDLSIICAVTRQTVSLILNSWKKEGVIEIHRGYLEVLNKEKLIDIFLENTILR